MREFRAVIDEDVLREYLLGRSITFRRRFLMDNCATQMLLALQAGDVVTLRLTSCPAHGRAGHVIDLGDLVLTEALPAEATS